MVICIAIDLHRIDRGRYCHGARLLVQAGVLGAILNDLLLDLEVISHYMLVRQESHYRLEYLRRHSDFLICSTTKAHLC